MTIEVAVISQFRAGFLKKCLESLHSQTRLPDRVILVLHPQDKNSRGLTERFKYLSFTVRTFGKSGYAPLRNIALQTSKGDFLYFIDDDCILSPKAIQSAYGFLSKHNEYVAVQGRTINFDTSFYSQFAQWTNDLWLERLWDKKNKTLGSIDTKNVCLRRKAIEKMRFFECLGSEDVDFGLQISTSGGKIGYNPKMLVYHKEQANNLLTYIRKRMRMMRGLAIVKKRWQKSPYFYESNQNYEAKIREFFLNSRYKNKLSYRLFLEIVFLLRKLRKFYDSLVFQCKTGL